MTILINDWHMIDLYELHHAVNLKNACDWWILVEKIELETIGRNGVPNLFHFNFPVIEKVTDSVR